MPLKLEDRYLKGFVNDHEYQEIQRQVSAAHQLLQAGGNGKAPAVRNPAEEHVKIRDLVTEPLLEIAVAHSQLVKVAEHARIPAAFGRHNQNLTSRSQSSGKIFPISIAPIALFRNGFLDFPAILS